ncbi:P-type Ca(2+) transporter [Malassezia caprae]|uniref:P-type Ca(2+) transporter n=1 Tax=Malassezia caprae TaxID=1381934 RepID=A0AAF0E4P8_9BASI|nr:P-type Ca(2+) transporter [Malassezia caprae]
MLGGGNEAREMDALKQELRERMWRDPSPFQLKAGDLCSLIDPQDFEKLEKMGGIEGLVAGLGTSADKGLLLLLMWLALQDKILVLLIVAAIVSLSLGLYIDFSPPPEYTPCLDPPPGMDQCIAPKVNWVEGVAVLVAVAIVDLVGSLNDWQKERQFRSLDSKKEARNIKVLREGKQCLVDVHDVVVGDIVTVEPGEVIAFDGVMLRSHNVKCDESSATGESDMIQKVTYDEYIHELKNGSVKHKSVFVLSGSKVLEGVGDFVVTAVGPLSMNGKLMMSLREEPANTPLQGKLNKLAELIAKLDTVEILIQMGRRLPLANKMNVVAGCVGSDLLYLDSIKLEIDNTQMNEETIDLESLTEHLAPDVRDALTKLICINSTAFIPSQTDKEDHVVSSTMKRPWWARIFSRPNNSLTLMKAAKSETGFIGSKTETALLNLVKRLNWGEYDQIRNAAEIVQVLPFSSKRKAMGVVIKTKNGYRFYVKGATIAAIEDPLRYGKDLAELAPHLHILARSSPEDKKTLTDMLKSMGETVAVTGDGTNDGPALKSANVGFSMGISGSEVAKEASDIILLDDNFSSIVNAIVWGRCVNDAVRKFLQFQITVNIVAVVVTFVTSISNNGEASVLTPVQLLWLNLIMDTLAALALATDPADPKSLNRKPDRASMPLITVEMWKQIFVQSAYQIILIFVLHYRGKDILGMHDEVRAIALVDNLDLNTLVFNSFVWCQLFNQVNTRRLDRHLNIFYNIHKNIWFILILIIEVCCQVLIIYIGGAAFSVKRIGGRDWGISIISGLCVNFIQVRDTTSMPHIVLYLDWDETITAKDTLSLLAPTAEEKVSGPTFEYYQNEYVHDHQRFVQNFGEIRSKEDLLRVQSGTMDAYISLPGLYEPGFIDIYANELEEDAETGICTGRIHSVKE